MNPRQLMLLPLLIAAPARAQEALSQLSGAVTLATGLQQLAQRLSPRASERELFAVATRENKRFLELRQGQLERMYLFAATLERGTGENGVYSTTMLDTFLVSFRWAGGRIQVLRRNVDNRAQPGSPEERAARNSFSDSLLATLPVVSSDAARGTLTVSADALFMADLVNLQGWLRSAYPNADDLSMSRDDSVFERAQSFPRNAEFQVQLVFARSRPSGSETLPDSRRIALVVRYSLTELPSDASFEPREADARVGYFETGHHDFSRPDLRARAAPAVHLIHRWNLEKRNPDAEVSEVVRPITVWIEDTVPEEHRPAMRRGILAWNAAFEAAGFRNAIVVREVDKDLTPEERARFDPADVSYQIVVRWFMGRDAGYAMGPSRVNPLTGEIFNALVQVSDSMTRFIHDRMDFASSPRPRPSLRCPICGGEHADEHMRRASAGLALLEAGGRLPDAERRRYMDEYMVSLMAHEIGHTLGLRHNFKGSRLHPLGAGGEQGLVSSTFMDYDPPNISTPGATQRAFYQTAVGPYDRWAIEYGYRPLAGDAAARRRALAAIAARADRDESLAYATDEDADAGDPDARRWDLGRDPVAFARARVELARGLWRRLDERAAAGEDGAPLRRQFLAAFSEYRYASRAATSLVGGVRVSRSGGTTSYAPVPAAEQRQALRFLNDTVFAADSVVVPPRLLRRMGQERVGQWTPDEPVSPAALASRLRREALDSIFEPATMRRLLERDALATDASDALGLREVTAAIRDAVWSELAGSRTRPVSSQRRALQREHIAILIRVLGDAETPGEARGLARGDLGRIRRDIDQALASRRLGEETREHLESARADIRAALDPLRRPSA